MRTSEGTHEWKPHKPRNWCTNNSQDIKHAKNKFEIFLGASVEVKGIDHAVSTTKAGEYWKLLMPGTYLVRVKDSFMGLSTKFYQVQVPHQVSKNHGKQSNAIRFDFQLWEINVSRFFLWPMLLAFLFERISTLMLKT